MCWFLNFFYVFQIQKNLEEAQEKFKSHEIEDAKLREEMRNLNMKRKKLINLKKQEEEQMEKLEKLPETNDNKIQECLSLKEKLETQCQEEQEKYDKAMESLNVETREYQVK